MWGLLTKGSGGTAQIDSMFKNVVYVGKATVSQSSWTTGNTVGVSTPPHDFAFLGDTGGSFVSMVGSTVRSGGRQIQLMTSAPSALSIFLYRAQPPGTGDYGLIVNGPDGAPVFNSNDNHLSILDSSYFSPEEGGVITVPSAGQRETIALPPLPSLRGFIQMQGQSLAMLYFLYKAIRVNNAARQVDIGAISRMAAQGHPADGPPSWTFPTEFPVGSQIIVAGHYGAT